MLNAQGLIHGPGSTKAAAQEAAQAGAGIGVGSGTGKGAGSSKAEHATGKRPLTDNWDMLNRKQRQNWRARHWKN